MGVSDVLAFDIEPKASGIITADFLTVDMECHQPLRPFMHCIYDVDLRVGYIDDTGTPLSKARMLNTVFQVWERRSELRPKMAAPDRGYVTKATPERADMALAVFGRGHGRVSTEFP